MHTRACPSNLLWKICATIIFFNELFSDDVLYRPPGHDKILISFICGNLS